MMNIELGTPISQLIKLLNKYHVLFDKEIIKDVTKAGEGNMNVVLRVKTNHRSFIFKQSRPYIQKYQDILAPINRIDVEYNFYKSINIESNYNFPKILNYCKQDYFMIQEDLGSLEDFSTIYSRKKISNSSIIKLTKVLNDIHSSKYDVNYPKNSELKKLNHQHIFILPFVKENGFSLNSIQPGLENLAHLFINDISLINKSKTIGERYLDTGETLLHGDFYPGSWIRNKEEIYVIDPEFSFLGDLEFDLGVFIAHIIIATQEKKYLPDIISYYSGSVDVELINNYTGIEIIRRIIGLAQLPINLSIVEKEKLLNFSKGLILN